MTPLLERLVLLSIAAAAWPLWWPFLKRVIEEIQRATAVDDDEAARPAAPVAGRHRHFVNSAWDDMHLGRKGHTHVARRDGDGFVHRG